MTTTKTTTKKNAKMIRATMTPDEIARNERDREVVDAMGAKFAEFQKLAALVAEQPATRAFAEAEMARLLGSMSESERLALRRALVAAGARKGGR